MQTTTNNVTFSELVPFKKQKAESDTSISRCMEHSIDLAACHFIQAVAPLSMQKIIKKLKCTFRDAAIKDTVDLDALDAHIAAGSFDLIGDDDSEAEEGDEETFDMFDTFDIADSIGKALSLVKQVSLDVAYAGFNICRACCLFFRFVCHLRHTRSL